MNDMGKIVAEFGSTVDEPIFRCTRCGELVPVKHLSIWVQTLIGYCRPYHDKKTCRPQEAAKADER